MSGPVARPRRALRAAALAGGLVPLAASTALGALGALGAVVVAAPASAAPGVEAVGGPAPAVLLRGDAPAPGQLPPALAPQRATAVLAGTVAAAPVSTWDLQFTGALRTPEETAQAQNAVRRAAQIWSSVVASPVPIKVAVEFAPTERGVLAATSASSYYRGSTIGNGTSYYPSALADALYGRDIGSVTAGGAPTDISVTVSSTEPGIYYGTDGNPAPSQIDLETVSLHELGHGLGIAGWMSVDAAGNGVRSSATSIYDAFTAYGPGLAPVRDLAAGPALGAALTSGTVVWNGPAGKAANGGAPLPLFSPRPWQYGSSYSHLDDDRFPKGSPDSLMTPYVDEGEVVRDPGALAVGMLRDLGWPVSSGGSGPAPVSDIDLRYSQDARLRGVLGAPTGPETEAAGVHVRPYQGGRLYSSRTTGAQSVQGAVLERYLALGDYPAYGLPLTDELVANDGAGRYNDFAGGGSIYWSLPTGAHEVHGLIRLDWLGTGGPRGPLGYPTTEETVTPDLLGRFNHFSKAASVYWSPTTGAHEVHGLVRQVWADSGWEAGPAGYPTTDESATPDRVGRYNHFSKGASIYWSPGTGAHLVHGGIREKWAALGWELGPEGYPVTSELGAADGVGRYNDFSKGASIYWSPLTGAHEVRGAIRDRWAALGGPRGYLGYPTSDEFAVAGGRRTNFTGGYVVWTPAGGAVDRR